MYFANFNVLFIILLLKPILKDITISTHFFDYNRLTEKLRLERRSRVNTDSVAFLTLFIFAFFQNVFFVTKTCITKISQV